MIESILEAQNCGPIFLCGSLRRLEIRAGKSRGWLEKWRGKSSPADEASLWLAGRRLGTHTIFCVGPPKIAGHDLIDRTVHCGWRRPINSLCNHTYMGRNIGQKDGRWNSSKHFSVMSRKLAFLFSGLFYFWTRTWQLRLNEV